MIIKDEKFGGNCLMMRGVGKRKKAEGEEEFIGRGKECFVVCYV